MKINNVEINSKKNDRRQFEVKRYLGKNNQINITYSFQLKAHIQSGELDQNWLAYTYGPITLAEKLNSQKDFTSKGDKYNRSIKNKLMSENEPFQNSNINEVKFYLDKISITNNDKLMFRILNNGILLERYFSDWFNFFWSKKLF